MAIRAVFFILTLCGIATLPAQAPKAAPAARINPEGVAGSLVICGGGKTPEAVLAKFVELAGGDKAQIVVIPTASQLADTEPDERWLQQWNRFQPTSLTVLHTRSRKTADAAMFIDPLKKASGVWFSGGDQSRLTEVYADTQVENELRAFLKRGGVIGGTSAGAAVMSRIMIASGQTKALTARGFDLFPGAVVDQHFTQRQRQDRLIDALAQHPVLFGVGVDEATALIVRGRTMSVLGAGGVTLELRENESRPRRAVVIRQGDVADLTAWRRAAIARAGPAFPLSKTQESKVKNGALVIVGGGYMPNEVLREFVKLAGGPDAPIVVLPTAMDNPSPRWAEADMFRKAGARNVHVLTARRQDDVESPETLEILGQARGVWFGGGRQWRFVDAYEGTKAQQLFHDVLARGGVIGGTSAGATIQGEYLCRGSPLNNTEMMSEGYERGFAFLPGTAIDQHFAERKRFVDMTALMNVHPQLLGIGIDEGTALIVRRGIANVMGKNHVHFYNWTMRPTDGQADHESIRSGGRYNLVDRKVID